MEEIEVVMSWLSKVVSCFEDSVSIGGIESNEESKDGFFDLCSLGLT